MGKNNIIIDVLVNNAGIKVPSLGLVGLIYYVFQLWDGFIRPVMRGSHAIVYRPQDSDYYRCVEDYFETFIQFYDDYFSRQYGFWRPYVQQVIHRYPILFSLELLCQIFYWLGPFFMRSHQKYHII